MNPTVIDSLVRVGGRLTNAPLSFSARHPIIMPNDHHVTRLLEDYHRRMGHQGMSSTWTALRQSFWILKGAATVRNVLGKCLFCRRRNARPGVQMMTDLPKERLTPNKPPFSQGLTISDHSLFDKGGVISNAMGAFLPVFTTRAVHLEVAHSYRRFIHCCVE